MNTILLLGGILLAVIYSAGDQVGKAYTIVKNFVCKWAPPIWKWLWNY